MARRVAIFLDGTWNNPESYTNVYSLYQQCEGVDARNISPENESLKNTDQIFYYDEGVGSNIFRILGGSTGLGLSRNIKQAYEFLCRHYRDNDEIFIFGFSRGAYTARSLAGLISAVGLLPPKHLTQSIIQNALDTYKYHNQKREQASIKKRLDARSEFRKQWDCKDNVRIKMLGVWDTVGALGIPTFIFPWMQRRNYHAMHDTELTPIVDHAYQALAIDEHRAIFRHTPWTKKQKENRDVEQRWFVGAHANIGGGVRDSKLSDIAYIWMQDKAVKAGLSLYRKKVFNEDLLLEPIHDSWREFAFGLYKKFASKVRYFRKIDIDSTIKVTPEGDEDVNGSASINETIDPSVWKYIDKHPDYSPPNLSLSMKSKQSK